MPSSQSSREPEFASYGLSPVSAVGIALAARGNVITSLRRGSYVVVGAQSPDVEQQALEVLGAGASVLIEDPGALSVDALRRIAKAGPAYAAFRFRFEPLATESRNAIQRGSIGLVWATNIESVWASPGRPVGTMADIVDAVIQMAGLELQNANWVSLDPLVLCLHFANGVVGTAAVIARPTGIEGEGWTRVTMLASHGSVAIDLLGPAIHEQGQNSGRIPFRDIATSRLIDAFVSGHAPRLQDAATVLETLTRSMPAAGVTG